MADPSVTRRRRPISVLRAFLSSEAAGGLLLMGAAALALVVANSSLAPAYFAVLAYLSTLQLIECMDVRWIYSGHWPAYCGPAVQEFLAQCRAFLGCVEEQIDLALERHPGGISLRNMIEECGPALGKWPPANRWLLMYPFHGHLALREERGHVTRVKTDGLTLWRRC